MIDEERRGFFSSLSSFDREAKKQSSPIRPPYCNDDTLFQKYCPGCEAKRCVGVCEEEIIVIAADGTPALDFTRRGCTFCDACAKACEDGVLQDLSAQSIAAEVEIDVLRCVAWHQVMCSSCKDPCLEDAIRFLGLFRPEIVMDNCTACGWCKTVCPADAIEFKPKRGGSSK